MGGALKRSIREVKANNFTTGRGAHLLRSAVDFPRALIALVSKSSA